MNWKTSFCLAAGLFAFSGCGSNHKPMTGLVPVTGVVNLDGKPLAGANVSFRPTGAKMGSGSDGMTNAEGKFELTSLGSGPGAMPGSYKVVISKLVLPNGNDIPADSKEAPITLGAKEKLPPIYSDVEATTLTATVKAGGEPVTFDLKSK